MFEHFVTSAIESQWLVPGLLTDSASEAEQYTSGFLKPFDYFCEADLIQKKTQDALFQRVLLFQRFCFSKGTPSILLFFDFGNSKLDINR